MTKKVLLFNGQEVPPYDPLVWFDGVGYKRAILNADEEVERYELDDDYMELELGRSK